MRTTTDQDKKFINDVISSTLLEDAIEHIKNNFSPADIFDESDLENWAENNGYIKED